MGHGSNAGNKGFLQESVLGSMLLSIRANHNKSQVMTQTNKQERELVADNKLALIS